MSATRLLVCDDSAMARKQLIRGLPEGWPVSVSQAANGREGLEAIRQGRGDVVLLDLTMPEMDGYEVLEALRREGLPSRVIVVSGDVQDEAVRRVEQLGALAFIRKPADPVLLKETLERLDLLAPPSSEPDATISVGGEPDVSFHDAFREVVNIAMGRAGAMLARVLGVFVQLPIPNVNEFEAGELHIALLDAQEGERLTAICQGFIGGGIAGEALLIFHDSEVSDMAKLMRWHAQAYPELEMLLDLSSLLVGACLSGLAEMIDVAFSQSHPLILGEHASIDELIRLNRHRWKKMLAVEISYSLERHAIHFDLLFLFTEDSLDLLSRKLNYLMD